MQRTRPSLYRISLVVMEAASKILTRESQERLEFFASLNESERKRLCEFFKLVFAPDCPTTGRFDFEASPTHRPTVKAA